MKPVYINKAMIFVLSTGELRRVRKNPYKVFREERERPVFISVDNRLAMHFATRGVFKSVLAAKLGGLLAWAADYHGDRIGGQLFSEHECRELKTAKWYTCRLAVLNALVKPQNPLDKEFTLDHVLARLNQHARPVVWFISSVIFAVSMIRLKHISQSYPSIVRWS